MKVSHCMTSLLLGGTMHGAGRPCTTQGEPTVVTTNDPGGTVYSAVLGPGGRSRHEQSSAWKTKWSLLWDTWAYWLCQFLHSWNGHGHWHNGHVAEVDIWHRQSQVSHWCSTDSYSCLCTDRSQAQSSLALSFLISFTVENVLYIITLLCYSLILHQFSNYSCNACEDQKTTLQLFPDYSTGVE